MFKITHKLYSYVTPAASTSSSASTSAAAAAAVAAASSSSASVAINNRRSGSRSGGVSSVSAEGRRRAAVRRHQSSPFTRLRASRTPVVFKEPLSLQAEGGDSPPTAVSLPAVGFYSFQEPLAFCCASDPFSEASVVDQSTATLTLTAAAGSSGAVCCSEFSQTLASRTVRGAAAAAETGALLILENAAVASSSSVGLVKSLNVVSSPSSPEKQHLHRAGSIRSIDSLSCSARAGEEEAAAGYSAIMLLYYFASAVKNAHFHVDDDIVDKLSYHYTGSIIIIFAILVSAKQFVGFPIQCWVPATFTEPMEQYTENFCWVQNTYWLQLHDYVPQNYAERDSRQIGYYQWVPFILALEALLFYLPCLAWRLLSAQSGIHVQSLVQMACDSRLLDKESRQKALDIISTHVEESLHIKHHIGAGTKFKLINVFVCTRSAGSAVTCLYLSIKFLYGVNVASQILLLNALLGNRDMMYGFHVLNDLLHSREWDESGNFPRVTLCDFEVKVLGNVHRHTVQCVLMINMFNEKIFLFLWFWYILLLCATICSFIYWIFITVLPGRRLNFVNKYLVGLEGYRMVDSQSLRRFVFNFLRYDGVFLLRMTATHAGDLACCDLAKTLWNRFHDNKERAHDI